jgi:hypothetical protein
VKNGNTKNRYIVRQLDGGTLKTNVELTVDFGTNKARRGRTCAFGRGATVAASGATSGRQAVTGVARGLAGPARRPNPLGHAWLSGRGGESKHESSRDVFA